MNRALPVLVYGLAFGLACAVAATPILAQRDPGRGGDRPSRQCMREIVDLCGRDRSQIRSCLMEKASELSDSCQGELRQRMQQRAEGPRQTYQAAVKPTSTIVFGEHSRQQIDIYEPEGAVDELPLVLFVHGGGWSMGSHKLVQTKPQWFGEANFYFASTGYRLLPETPVEQQAADVGAAVKAVVGQAGSIGFDPDRIVLMGHSAGAHLAALVASDPQYAGEAFDAIKGVVLLDGAAYDVAANMEDAKPAEWQIYFRAFGNEAERQKALSPVTHVGGKDAPHWLALYVEEREAAKTQAEMLVGALASSGVEAEAISISGTDHGRMNRELGTDAGSAQTQAVAEFIAAVFD